MKLRPPFVDDLGIPVKETYWAMTKIKRINDLKEILKTATQPLWIKLTERDLVVYERASWYFLLLIVERAE